MQQITETTFQRGNIKSKLLKLPNLYNKQGNINSNIKKLLTTNDLDVLDKLYPTFSCGIQVYCIINDIDLPLCVQCGQLVKYFDNTKKLFAEFCSIQCSRKNKKSIAKRASTKLKKYGHAGFNNREKARTTNLEKYNVINPTMLPEIQNKISTTLKQNYTNNHNDIIDKKNETFNNKYGSHPNLTSAVQEKKKIDTLQKYGVEHTTQLSTVIEKIRVSKNAYYDNSYADTLAILGQVDTSTHTQTQISELTGKSLTVVKGLINRYNIQYKYVNVGQSQLEDNIIQYICSLVDNVHIKTRAVLNSKELDIYIPDYKLAIEVNGIYWHSEKFKDKNYHLDKTNECEKQGIQLLHIFENEWTDPTRREIWKGMIKSRLKLNQRIHARKCKVNTVTTTESRLFLENNHLQGFRGGTIKLGLYYNEELVQLIIVGKPRFNKKYDFELIRAASLKGVTVQGGLSKLISKLDAGSLISYADRRYATGNSYSAIGMTQLKTSPPNYFYVIKNELHSRLKYQKHKLSSILTHYNGLESEIQNMYNHGYYRLWDCGNLVFIKDK